MHLLRLPFADDIRSFDFPWTSLESIDGTVGERSLFETDNSRDASGVDDKAMKEEQVRRAIDVLSGERRSNLRASVLRYIIPFVFLGLCNTHISF